MIRLDFLIQLGVFIKFIIINTYERMSLLHLISLLATLNMVFGQTPPAFPPIVENLLLTVNPPLPSTTYLSSKRIESIAITTGATTTNFTAVFFNRSAPGNYSMFNITNADGVWAPLTGTNNTASCNLLHDSLNDRFGLLQFQPDLNIFRFAANVSKSVFPAVLQALTLEQIAGSVIIGQNCTGGQGFGAFYAYNATNQSLSTAVIPAGSTFQAMTESYTYGIVNSQLYKFNKGTNTYTLVRSLITYSNWKILQSQGNLVVYGWSYQGSTPQTQITNFSIYIIKDDPAQGVVVIETITDAYMGNYPVFIQSSPFLTKFGTGYTRPGTSNTTITARSIRWDLATSQPIQFQNQASFQQFSTTTNSDRGQLIFSDYYLYLRNASGLLQNPALTPWQVCYQFVGPMIVEMRRDIISSFEATNWTKSWVDLNTTSMVVLSSFQTPNGYQLKELLMGSMSANQNSQNSSNLAPIPSFLSFPKPLSPTFTYLSDEFPAWTFASNTSGNSSFSFFGANSNPAAANHLIASNLTLPGANWVQLAQNKYCKLLGSAPSNYTMLRVDPNNLTAGYQPLGQIPIPNITITTTTKFNVSQNCQSYRVDSFVYLRSPTANSNFTQILNPTSLNATAFSPNLTYAIANTVVYRLGQNGSYLPIFNETGFLASNQIFENPFGGFIVASTGPATGGSKLQLTAYGLNSSSQISQFFNFTAVFSGQPPAIRASPNATKIVIVGNLVRTLNGSTITNKTALGFFFNFGQRTAQNITLPNQNSTIPNNIYFKLSESFLYSRVLPDPNNATAPPLQEFLFFLAQNVVSQQVWNKNVTSADQTNWRSSYLFDSGSNALLLTSYEINGSIVVNSTQKAATSPQSNGNSLSNAGTIIQNGVSYICSASGCQTCSGLNLCTACSSGYVLDSSTSQCTKCGPNCLNCSSSNGLSCTSCFNGAFLNANNTCQPCTHPCISCGASGICQQCPPGLSLAANGSCISGCPPNCLNCTISGSTATCVQCRPGFVVNSQGKCRQCISSCSTCDPSNITTCTSCGDGLQLSNGACIRCPANCLSCANGLCVSCILGYTVNSAGVCIPSCHLPCSTCVDNQPDSCLSCYGGSTLSGTSCLPNTSCNTNSSCTACGMGYVLVAGSCIACNTGDSNCLQCTVDNTQLCNLCKMGFYLNVASTGAASCVACDSSCKACTSSTICLACAIGYTLPVNTTQGSCIACTSPCASCIGSADNCLSCVSGYSLAGWKCKSNSNVGFSLTLTVDATTILNNIDSIIAAILALINQNSTTLITLTNITSGSTILTGSLDSSTPTSDAAALSAALAVGTTLSGYPVGASSFSSSQAPSSNGLSTSTIVIIAVVVPLAAIIFGIIVFVILRKRMSSDVQTIVPVPPSNDSDKIGEYKANSIANSSFFKKEDSDNELYGKSKRTSTNHWEVKELD